jgi:hypothetical protein
VFEPETDVIELQARLGRVGSIQAWNPWKSRRSLDDAKWWCAKVASLSYGNDDAKDHAALFDRLVKRGHHAVLEFVPVFVFSEEQGYSENSIPLDSFREYGRNYIRAVEKGVNEERARHALSWMFPPLVDCGETIRPASAFLIECPLYTRSQVMRHRSMAYLEMSRRYTKGSKVGWEYYGHCAIDNPAQLNFHIQCEQEYYRRLASGMPNEIARGCMPMEAMTRFWVAGFDRDWDAFVKLRSDAHAQEEIRVFSNWIKEYLEKKRGT